VALLLNPQPGDEVRIDGLIRRIVRLDKCRLGCESERVSDR
jgi:hypothetical protein